MYIIVKLLYIAKIKEITQACVLFLSPGTYKRQCIYEEIRKSRKEYAYIIDSNGKHE